MDYEMDVLVGQCFKTPLFNQEENSWILAYTREFSYRLSKTNTAAVEPRIQFFYRNCPIITSCNLVQEYFAAVRILESGWTRFRLLCFTSRCLCFKHNGCCLIRTNNSGTHLLTHQRFSDISEWKSFVKWQIADISPAVSQRKAAAFVLMS